MKLKALLFLVLAAVLPLAAPRTAQARADVSFDYFYDALLPYGEWIEVEGYGECWHPTDVDADWVPYSDGYLAYTDAGWTWVGYEEFAGIVYHYGRWLKVKVVGWCWVPDYEWGPAWLSWRMSDDYIGWAPLPPRAHWQPEIGISTWADTAYDIGPDFYNFCRVRDFGAPVLRPLIISRTRNVTIIRNTVNITNITYNTYGDVPVIYNGGPSYTVISSRCEHPIPTLKLVRHTHFDQADFHGGPGRFSPNARTVGNQLIVNAPIVAPPERPAFLKEKVTKVFAADKVTNGWAGVKNGKVRDDLLQQFHRETKGLTPYTAPAKAVVAADLKVVPTQADANAVAPVFTGKGGRGRGDGPPPVIAGQPPAPLQPATPVADTAKPMKEGSATAGVLSPGVTPPADPRTVARPEGEKGHPQIGGTNANNPPAVTGSPLKPFNPDAATNPVVTAPAQGKVIDPRAVEKTEHPKMGRENAQNPVAVTPPNTPVTGTVPAEPREGRGPKPVKDAPVGGFHPPNADPAAAQAQAAAEAARAAREQAAIQQQRMDAEKLRAAQSEADKAKAEQERMVRQREADANAAAIREKQATAREQATTQQQKMDAEKLRATQAEMEKLKAEQDRLAHQRDADANAAAMRQKQAADAAASNAEKEKMQAQQQQRAAQADREKLQADQERMNRQREADAKAAAAQQKQLEAQRQTDLQRQAEAAKQADVKRQQMEAQGQERQRQQQEQIAEQRKQQQMDQQRAAQEAAKQQAAERARAQQLEQQRAAQDAAKQQAAEQHRQQQMEAQRAAQDTARQQAAEHQRQQQMEQQRAAQEAGKQQAEQQRRAMDAQREQAARQQAEAQRAAQQQAAQATQAAQQQAAQQQAAQQQAAQDARRAEKEKDKDKSR